MRSSGISRRCMRTSRLRPSCSFSTGLNKMKWLQRREMNSEDCSQRANAQSRKLEQETTMQMQIELDEAYDSITQLNLELHDTSVADDRVGSPHFSGALDSSMTYSDMKAPPTNITEAPHYKVPAPLPESPKSTVPDSVDHERERNLGVQMKEGMMEKYRAVGGNILTPYFYSGIQLELPALLLTMEDVQKRFRDHINA